MKLSCWVMTCLVGLAACSDHGAAPPVDTPPVDTPPADMSPTTPPLAPDDPAALKATLDELALFPDKRVGTEGGHMATQYLMERMQAIGLQNLHAESFHFQRQLVSSSSLSVTVGGAASSPAHEVFDGSGSGHVDADVVWVGTAHPEELSGKDLTGKIALVDRDATYHRTSQYRNVIDAGAAAMLYLSTAPRNLIQIGGVRIDGFSALGPIPAVTIGGDDGAALKTALQAGAVHAVIDVSATSETGTGNNVIGQIPGSDAGGEIVLGAHYDTWYIGSGDNGGGVATLLGLAGLLAKEPQPRYTLTFVAYDGEEIGLLGGYDFLRKHRILGSDPILAVLNFEIPAANEPTLFGLGRSNHMALDTALTQAQLDKIYTTYLPMELVPELLGGIIPTDIQGIYRNGVPTASTAVNFPYYHTVEDTPDKVDTATMARVVDAFDQVVASLGADDPGKFVGLDEKLWTAQLTPQPRAAADPLVVDVLVADAAGDPQAGAQVTGTLLVDDFSTVGVAHGVTDADGKVTLTLPAVPDQPNRFLHVSAGPTYPFVEQVLPLD